MMEQQKKVQSGNFLVRYGMSLAMVVILAIVGVILERIQLKDKITADWLRKDKCDYIYVGKESFSFGVGDTLHLDVSGQPTLLFRIMSVKVERLSDVFVVQPLDPAAAQYAMKSNTRISGYIFTRDVKFVKALLSK